MRKKLALTKSVAALTVTFEELQGRASGVPGMALVHGYTGAGKTTAVTWLVNRVHGVYVRATSGWTPTAMLGRIMRELGAEPLHRRAQMLEFIGDQLAVTNRTLFVDEADYLLRQSSMLDSLRDLHDLSGAPVLLIGMEGIERRLTHKPQLARRISHWVEFRRSDLDDARTLAETVCEVAVDDDLLELVHRQARGSVGLMCLALSRVEALAKANGWSQVEGAAWGGRSLFLGHRVEAPID